MRRDIFLVQALRQMARHAFNQPAGVHEHQGGTMRADELGQPIVDLCPHLARHHRLERRRRQFQLKIAAASVAAVDNGAAAGSRPARANQELRHLVDRLLSRGQSDPRQCAPRQRLQPLERQGQVCAALVAGNGVNLIDDHRATGLEHVAAGR